MEFTVTILNDEGFHARPAGIFAKKATQFKSSVEIKANGQTKNAKSIMSLMGLGLEKGSEMTIVTQGDDEKEALDSLVTLVNNRFAV